VAPHWINLGGNVANWSCSTSSRYLEEEVILATDCPPSIAHAAPSDPHLTDYDRSHIVTYLRLLDAAEDAAPWAEVCRIVLGVDASEHPDKARAVYDTHLARARWISDHGYRDLLQK
jgi:hypothetical protein